MLQPFPRARVALVLAASLLVSTTAGADVTLKQKTSSSGMGGMGGSSATSTMVVSGDKSRSDEDVAFGGETHHVTRVTRLDSGVIWTIHDDRKEYSELAIDDIRKQMAQAGAVADSAFDSIKVDVKLTGKTDTVNGFAAEEAILTTSGALPAESPIAGTIAVTADVWVSKAVPGGDELHAFGKAFAEKAGVDPASQRMGRMGRMFGGSVQRVSKELSKLDGVPVSTTVKIELKSADADGPGGPGGMGPMTFTTELLSASADKSTVSFDLPKDYKKVEERGFGGMGAGRGPGPGGRGGDKKPDEKH